MKHSALRAINIVTVVAMTGSSLSLHAADPIQVQWNQVCRMAAGRELFVTTTNGDTLEGYCVSIDLNEIAVTTKDHKVVRVARATLERLEMHRAKGHQFSSLVKGVHRGLQLGFDSLLSPTAPLGLVILPGTLAWGAVAAPFCLLGDLRYKATGKQEIKLN